MASEQRYLDDPVRRVQDSHRLNGDLRARMAAHRVPMDRVVAHIEHVVRVAGEDCVAFGSDFDGVPDVPEGLTDCAGFPFLLERMRQRGFSEAAIAKIAGANFRRVLDATPERSGFGHPCAGVRRHCCRLCCRCALGACQHSEDTAAVELEAFTEVNIGEQQALLTRPPPRPSQIPRSECAASSMGTDSFPTATRCFHISR